jgi:hypothetical protein
MGYIYGMGSLLCLPKSEQEATLKRFHEFDEEVLEGHSEVQKFINLYETNYEEMSFNQMIEAWGWDATYDEEDNLIHLAPLSDYLPDEAELFFRILASSVQDQGYVELEEEGVRYRWYFLNGYAIEQEAAHTYPSDEETLAQIEKLIEKEKEPAMPERVKGPMPKSTLRLASEAIRELALEDGAERNTGEHLFDICVSCGHTYSNALVPERPAKKQCPHCHSDAKQIHVKLSW